MVKLIQNPILSPVKSRAMVCPSHRFSVNIAARAGTKNSVMRLQTKTTITITRSARASFCTEVRSISNHLLLQSLSQSISFVKYFLLFFNKFCGIESPRRCAAGISFIRPRDSNHRFWVGRAALPPGPEAAWGRAGTGP